MGSNQLAEYIKSFQRRTLHFNESTRDIGWKSVQGPRWETQYNEGLTPYTTLVSLSEEADLFNNTVRTDHALNAHELYEEEDITQELFHVRSTIADEGLVGIGYLWKWVKRMFVLPHWQKQVSVSFASDIPDGRVQWYTIGIIVDKVLISLRVGDRVWVVPISQLLAEDVENSSPFSMTVGEFLLLRCGVC